ncbi:hypothetical protein LEP1GSC171_0525 [Leptospira santarosai str. HAI1380]|nr:hypothetical protein LEP1GSC171_0525 [Leptospira santarosai str. HAI1380]
MFPEIFREFLRKECLFFVWSELRQHVVSEKIMSSLFIVAVLERNKARSFLNKMKSERFKKVLRAFAIIEIKIPPIKKIGDVVTSCLLFHFKEKRRIFVNSI